MSWLLEDPTTVLLIGGFALLLLAVAFYNTRHPRLLLALLGVAVATGALVLVEWLVVTQVEEVEQTMYGIADDLESNDLNLVLAHLDPNAADLQTQARAYLPGITIEACNLSHLSATVLPGTNQAEARFQAAVRFKAQLAGNDFPRPLIKRFVVQLRKSGDRWLMTGYREESGPLE